MEVKKSPTPSPWEASLVYSKFWDRQGYTVKACLEQKGNKKSPPDLLSASWRLGKVSTVFPQRPVN